MQYVTKWVTEQLHFHSLTRSIDLLFYRDDLPFSPPSRKGVTENWRVWRKKNKDMHLEGCIEA